MAKRRRIYNRGNDLVVVDVPEGLFDYYARQNLGEIKGGELLWCLHCDQAHVGKAWVAARQCPTLGCDGGWRDCFRDRWWSKNLSN